MATPATVAIRRIRALADINVEAGSILPLLGKYVEQIVPCAWVRIAVFAPPSGYLAIHTTNQSWLDGYVSWASLEPPDVDVLDRMTFSIRNAR